MGIGPINGGAGYGLEVALGVSLPGVERAVAEELVAKAHEVCPYSNATRGNIKVDLEGRSDQSIRAEGLFQEALGRRRRVRPRS